MEAESKQARSHSIWSASPRRFKSTRCRRSQSPASCHSRNRRQHVTPEPQPISWGNISQGMPLFSTKMMPIRAARSSTRGLPPCGLGDSGGSSSSITSHSSSLTNSLAIFSTYPDPVVLKGSLSAGRGSSRSASYTLPRSPSRIWTSRTRPSAGSSAPPSGFAVSISSPCIYFSSLDRYSQGTPSISHVKPEGAIFSLGGRWGRFSSFFGNPPTRDFRGNVLKILGNLPPRLYYTPLFPGLLWGAGSSSDGPCSRFIPCQTRVPLTFFSAKPFTTPLSPMTRVNATWLPGSMPSLSHHRSQPSNSAFLETRSLGPNTHASPKNRSTTSVSARYSAVALSTASDVPSPCSAHSMHPRTAHASTPGNSSRSLSGSFGSAFLPSNRCVQGIKRMRSHIASDPSGISGLWFVDSQSLNCGR